MKLSELIDEATIEGRLYERLENGRVRCHACGHRCLIYPGKRGVCKVRFNADGVLKVPYGYAAGIQSDPVEKKPYFHVLPGTDALTFGMLGCDYHCTFCQNWVTSQALRDENAGVTPRFFTPESLVDSGRRSGAGLVVSSYNEPLITVEWAHDIFEVARKAGFVTGFVSNGNATPEALAYILPVTDCYKVDLKAMRESSYREMGGMLENVLWTIEALSRENVWLEVVTLVVPGMNDSLEELRDAAQFLAGISREIPWHVTAFHGDYLMTDPGDTTAATLIRAAEIGAEAGLQYVYAGNLPGRVGDWENTRCPSCRETLIRRHGYVILSYSLTAEGYCPGCGHKVPGIWPQTPGDVRTGTQNDGLLRRPRPVSV